MDGRYHTSPHATNSQRVSNSIEHMGTFTEKDMNDALDQTANALKMGIGPWCRTMTKMLKATVAE